MFSKSTKTLALAISLSLTGNVMAQQTKKTQAQKAAEAKAAAAKKAADSKKAAELKELERNTTQEAAVESRVAGDVAAQADDAQKKEAAVKQAEAPKSFLSKFSVSYHGEYVFTRRVDSFLSDYEGGNGTKQEDLDVQDAKIMHNPTVIFRPMTNWKFLVTSEFKYTDAPPALAGTFINRHYRSLILLTRENVLTEKDNGIKLDLGIGRRIFDRNHGKAPSYGNNRVNATISKKFSDQLSTSMLVQYLANDPAKKKIVATTWQHSLELIPSFTFQITDKLSYFFNDDFIINTPWHNNTDKNIDISHEMNIGYVTYQFNDKNSAYFQLKYLHTSGAPFNKVTAVSDWFEYYIGYTYAITPKASITPEIGSELFAAKDKRDFFSQKIKYPEFAVYLDISI